MNNRHNIVLKLVELGVDLEKALIAATELTREEKYVEPPQQKDLFIDNRAWLKPAEIANIFGMGTRMFHLDLYRLGYLSRRVIENKPIRCSVEPNLTHTYQLTELGHKFGVEYAHMKHRDGTSAVNRFKWSAALIHELHGKI